MTIDKSPASLADALDAWTRPTCLRKGFRFYSSVNWFRWFRDEPDPIGKYQQEQQSLLPEMPSQFYVLDLETDTHESLTARLQRYLDIKGARFHSRRPRPVGMPHRRETDCPPIGWLEKAAAIWAALPGNDSDIFPRAASTESPKHRKLSTRLAPLLKWVGGRVGLSLDATNWLQADNDSYFDGEEATPPPASNRERRMRPGSSDAELLSFIQKAGPSTVWKHAKLDGGGAWELMATDADWTTVVDKRDRHGKVVKSHQTIARAGKLRIANGKTEAEGVRVEEGTILYQPDKFGELLGAEPAPAEAKRRIGYWTSLFDTARAFDADHFSKQEIEPVRHKKTGRVRRKVLLTAAEQANILATQPHPPVTYCKPGLPCGHDDIGAQFVGGWISTTKGVQPPERWQDVSDELARQAEFERWAAALPPEQQEALNLACTAANFKEIGEAFGRNGKAAERYGKKIVLTANDNVKKVMAA
ncbi:hypothetical protein [Mesorhizobium sp. LjNodule214]|uniref:hypothetical protein n=1 Tax=Mesorhizobium sp. LjNodule214 TaxID=3342252 RepID=UPI003ED0AFCF